MKKVFTIVLVALFAFGMFMGCGSTVATNGPSEDYSTEDDITATTETAGTLASNQKTPTDFDYSLERYNLIRRAYWVNGQRDKAAMVTQPIADMPIGYIVLIDYGVIVGEYVVEGKITSLNSFLTPSVVDEVYGHYGETGFTTYSVEMPDIDGSYGENDGGIFFFTPDGAYREWNGRYLYQDQPFHLNSEPLVG